MELFIANVIDWTHISVAMASGYVQYMCSSVLELFQNFRVAIVFVCQWWVGLWKLNSWGDLRVDPFMCLKAVELGKEHHVWTQSLGNSWKLETNGQFINVWHTVKHNQCVWGLRFPFLHSYGSVKFCFSCSLCHNERYRVPCVCTCVKSIKSFSNYFLFL